MVDYIYTKLTDHQNRMENIESARVAYDGAIKKAEHCRKQYNAAIAKRINDWLDEHPGNIVESENEMPETFDTNESARKKLADFVFRCIDRYDEPVEIHDTHLIVGRNKYIVRIYSK